MIRSDFAVFVMVYGRPDKMWTLQALRKHGYTGKVYFVADNLDKTCHKYKEKYGNDLIVFDKEKAATLYDSGDNSGDLRSTLYSANTIPSLAKERNIKYFMIMCDDYHFFTSNFNKFGEYNKSPKPAKKLDYVIESMIEFYEVSGALTLAMTQGGDFIGGSKNRNAHPQLLRKAMNTFLCSVDRPIVFMGRLNEDVTTYVNLGNKGNLFFSLTEIAIKQKQTQDITGGLTETYVDFGTYVKSFFSVMYNPSCVCINMMGDKHKRIHHNVLWKHAVPCIINESFRNI